MWYPGKYEGGQTGYDDGQWWRDVCQSSDEEAEHYAEEETADEDISGEVTYDSDMIRDVMFIPNNINQWTEENYVLTGYINDINTEHTQVLMEYGASGVRSAYEYGNERLSMTQGGETYYYMYDGRGSVSELTGSAGNAVVKYSYGAYGETNSASIGWGNNTTNPYRYNAERVDDIAGVPSFQYLRARYYNPFVGGFISQDTLFGELTAPLTQNLYIYCGGNPVNNYDPSGHCYWDGMPGEAGIRLRESEDCRNKPYTPKELERQRISKMSGEEIGKEVESKNKKNKTSSKGIKAVAEAAAKSVRKICETAIPSDSSSKQNSNASQNKNTSPKTDSSTSIPKRKKMSQNGINLLKKLEMPIKSSQLVKDSEGNVTHIKNHDVGDGGITVGYGHYVGKNEDDDRKKLMDKYGIDASKAGQAVSEEVASKILASDIAIQENSINNWLIEEKITQNDKQFDALVIYRFNKGNISALFDLLRKGDFSEKELYNAMLNSYSSNSNFNAGWANRTRVTARLYFGGSYEKDF